MHDRFQGPFQLLVSLAQSAGPCVLARYGPYLKQKRWANLRVWQQKVVWKLTLGVDEENYFEVWFLVMISFCLWREWERGDSYLLFGVRILMWKIILKSWWIAEMIHFHPNAQFLPNYTSLHRKRSVRLGPINSIYRYNKNSYSYETNKRIFGLVALKIFILGIIYWRLRSTSVDGSTSHLMVDFRLYLFPYCHKSCTTIQWLWFCPKE